MSETVPTSGSALNVTEKTFSSYNQAQGQKYGDIRPDYSPGVYKAVLDLHTSSGGQAENLVDVGCGPGLAARGLSSHFTNVVGLDPSSGMIATARSKEGVSSSGAPIRFEVSSAEDLGASLSPPIANCSIDLITASNAAHWFDMPRFWVAAARALKPGGTVALWTGGGISVHPNLPNAEAIQRAMDRYLETDIEAYRTEGNRLTRGRYIDLPLPWTIAEPVEAFDEGSFVRKEWSTGEDFFVGQPEVDMDTFERMMATGSPQTRWEQAHPEDAGTERDVLKILRMKIEQLLHEAGVEKGREMFKGQTQGTLLVVKKKRRSRLTHSTE